MIRSTAPLIFLQGPVEGAPCFSCSISNARSLGNEASEREITVPATRAGHNEWEIHAFLQNASGADRHRHQCQRYWGANVDVWVNDRDRSNAETKGTRVHHASGVDRTEGRSRSRTHPSKLRSWMQSSGQFTIAHFAKESTHILWDGRKNLVRSACGTETCATPAAMTAARRPAAPVVGRFFSVLAGVGQPVVHKLLDQLACPVVSRDHQLRCCCEILLACERRSGERSPVAGGSASASRHPTVSSPKS